MQIQKSLRKLANPEKARLLSRFFKTGKGEYGDGDLFLGITVPQIRLVAKQFPDLPMGDVRKLLYSKFHEERLCALVILVQRYRKSSPQVQKSVYDFYLHHRARINNWDLVDLSAPNIVGHYLSTRGRRPLYTLVRSERLWDRRIAVVCTLFFIRNRDFVDLFALCERLLEDEEDLMHKACGWMLREAWKRGPSPVEAFLRKYKARMPRTMLRYAIERMPPVRRKAFMQR